jgi:hypothetical protein
MHQGLFAAVVVVSLVVGCAPAAPVAPTPAAKSGASTGTKFGPKFQALLDKAKQGDGHIRAGMSAYTPEYIRAMEKQFGEEFGINITLENEPGHASREIPPKMIKGLVDYIDGCTNGVIQADIQGEGDIGMGTADTALDQMNAGAPLAIVWPDVIPFNSLGTCVPKITVDNEALAQVFFAWRNVEGEWLRAQMGSGGARPFYAPEADRFPLAKIAKEAGVTEDRLAQPKAPADFDKVEENRKVAIAGMKAGLQSGQTVPYP